MLNGTPSGLPAAVSIGQDLFTQMQKTIGKEEYYTQMNLKNGHEMVRRIDSEHQKLTEFLNMKVRAIPKFRPRGLLCDGTCF
jgi:hypothetical protein